MGKKNPIPRKVCEITMVTFNGLNCRVAMSKFMKTTLNQSLFHLVLMVSNRFLQVKPDDAILIGKMFGFLVYSWPASFE